MELDRLYLAGKVLGFTGSELKDYIDREPEPEKETRAEARDARRKENQAAKAAPTASLLQLSHVRRAAPASFLHTLVRLVRLLSTRATE